MRCAFGVSPHTHRPAGAIPAPEERISDRSRFVRASPSPQENLVLKLNPAVPENQKGKGAQMSSSKLAYLQKYVKTGDGANGRKKAKKGDLGSYQKPLTNVKIVDEDLDILKENSSEDDDNPQIADNTDFSKLSKELQHQLLRKGFVENSEEISDKLKEIQAAEEAPKTKAGTWVVVDDSKKNKKPRKLSSSSDSSASSSSDSDISRSALEKRKRVDTDSDDNEMKDIKKGEKKDLKKELKNALGIEESKEDSSKSDEEDDSDIEIDRKNPAETESAVSGARTATEFKMDLMRQKQKDVKLQKMADKFKRAETVYRDASGRRIDIKEKLKEALVDKKKELEKLNQERINEWGAGAIQKQEKEQKKDDLKKLQKESFIQNSISKDVDIELMKIDRDGDPLARIKSKDDKKGTAEFTNKLRRKCKFPGIPNRFGIEPGYRWDGVDRSNGYERRYMDSHNQRDLNRKLAYLENVKDM